MPAAFRSISSTTYAARTSTSITAPAGIVDGDKLILLYVIGQHGGAPAATLPAGFTAFSGSPWLVADPSDFRINLYAAWKTASGESGAYVVTHDGSSVATQGVMVAVSGAAAGAPQLTRNSGTDTTSTATGITTTGNDALVIFAAHNWDLYGSASPPTGSTPTFTERLDAGTSIIYVATGVLATAGATGNKSHGNLNQVSSYPWQALLIGVEAAGGGGGGGFQAAWARNANVVIQ